jgi:hypothetical protein
MEGTARLRRGLNLLTRTKVELEVPSVTRFFLFGVNALLDSPTRCVVAPMWCDNLVTFNQ